MRELPQGENTWLLSNSTNCYSLKRHKKKVLSKLRKSEPTLKIYILSKLRKSEPTLENQLSKLRKFKPLSFRHHLNLIGKLSHCPRC